MRLSAVGDRYDMFFFDGQRPSLQHESAVLVVFFRLVSVVAGVDRLKVNVNRKIKGNKP